MSSTPPTVFVTSATGDQGGAVARHLRRLGWPVHATVRDPSSAAAQALAAIGVQLTRATGYDDEDALRTALAGCSKVYLNVVADFADPSKEQVWSRRILQLAEEVGGSGGGVDHVVYTSGIYADKLDRLILPAGLDPAGVAARNMRAKEAVEADVRAGLAAGRRYTILRGAAFMQNYLLPKVAHLHPTLVGGDGVWVSPARPDSLVPLVDTEDIGRFAAEAFRDPDRFAGAEIDLVAEYRTPVQLAADLSRAAGRELRFEPLAGRELEERSKTDEMVRGFRVLGELGSFVDLDRVRAWGIPLTTFPEFLEREKDRVRATYGKAA